MRKFTENRYLFFTLTQKGIIVETFEIFTNILKY